MIVHCKNTLGDGTVIYKDYEVDDYVPEEDTEATMEDALDALRALGVNT